MNVALLLCGGRGLRFGREKSLLLLRDRPLFLLSLEVFKRVDTIDAIILVASTKNIADLRAECRRYEKENIEIVLGGETRFQSAKNGAQKAIEKGAKTILFQNVANPFLDINDIKKVLQSAEKYGAAAAARKVTSTIRYENGETVPRKNLWEMETPQAVRSDVWKKGVALSENDADDDVEIARRAGVSPIFVPTSFRNRKITFAEDLSFFQR